MAYTRNMRGKYTGHRSPGDGTGFTHFTPKSPYDVLEDVKGSSPNAEHTNATQEEVICDYPARGKRY